MLDKTTFNKKLKTRKNEKNNFLNPYNGNFIYSL